MSHSNHNKQSTFVVVGANCDSFAAGDIKTARTFERNFAETLARVAIAA